MFYSIRLFLNVIDGQVVAGCVLTTFDNPQMVFLVR